MDLKNKVILPTHEIPTSWYNVIPDLPELLPELLDVDDGVPRVEMMKKIRPEELNLQDTSTESWIKIPDDVLEKFVQIGRPTPLQRAVSLEKYLGTTAKIYFKREDVLPTGSFKLNSAIAQAYYAKKQGFTTMISETGAGQWGMALAQAARLFDMDCKIYMARVSLRQKVYRRAFIEMMGGEVWESPSDRTKAGREKLLEDPEHPGSLGIGISEAIETAMNHIGEYAYASGSNLPHVLLHQTIIGLETKKQLEMIDEDPDVLIACVGGGSNLGGMMFPFLPDKLKRNSLRFLAAESDAVPRLTKGEYKYDFGDSAGITPLVKSYSLGMDFVPPPIHTGGLRQHNGSPLVGVLRSNGLLEAKAFNQEEVFAAGELFVKTEGIIPAPETCHAILAAIKEAEKVDGKKTIVFCFSGIGHLDLMSYDKVLFQREVRG